MFRAKEVFSKTSNMQRRLPVKNLHLIFSGRGQYVSFVNIFKTSSSYSTIPNLKILQNNVNLRFCDSFLEKRSRMDARFRRREYFKNTVLSYLKTDPKFVAASKVPSDASIKVDTEVQKAVIQQQKITQEKYNRKEQQQQYFKRVVMHSLGKNPKSFKTDSAKLVNNEFDKAVLRQPSQQVRQQEYGGAIQNQQVWKHVVQSAPRKNFNTQKVSQNLQNPSTLLPFDINYNLSDSTVVAPKSTLHNFFNNVAKELSSRVFLLETPEFSQINDMVHSCTYKFLWPKPLCFTELGINKKDASHNSASTSVRWLKENNFMTQHGKPIFQNAVQSRLKVNNNVGFTSQNRAYSTSKIDAQPTKTDTKTAVEFDLVERTKSLYPAPKNILHNCFDIVSNELKQKDLKLSPLYKIIKEQKKSMWMCTYNLKWPEVMKFSVTSITKQEASHKAAVLALSWLKQNNKITKEGQPIIYNKKEVSKVIQGAYPTLELHRDVEKEISKIVNVYKDSLAAQLDIDKNKDLDDAEENAVEALAEDRPEASALNSRQKLMGTDFYLAREPVELPISKYKADVIELVKNNQVLIVKGEPGCGKSTRVPQYVLEAWSAERNVYEQPCQIIVTQPRRIAAISLAERVANEREEQVGYAVGYQVRFNSNFNKHTGHIMYCTTGILLRRLQSDPKLLDCSHVILDEAHERDVNTDLLMNLLRYALKLNPNLKILIMSATMDAKAFQDYFNNASILHIPGFTYPVKDHFLKENSSLSKTYQMCMGHNPQVVAEDVASNILNVHRHKPEGAILCFLPGWEDIMKVKNLLPETYDMAVLCLHSRLHISEQRKIFSRPPPGVRKVILATNIAETSVTIDDVVYVIDTGIHKEERFDVDKGVTCIDNYWVSQASANQRRGRAGRCQPGECFHLYPELKYKQFLEYSIPEILRTSLTKIVLDSKVYSNNMNAVEFVEQLVSPPDRNAVEKAVEELQELELLDAHENLTPLGRTVSDFQLAPKLSKAMVNAIIFKCVSPIIDIATLYSAETAIFAKGLVDKEGIKQVMSQYCKTSDHLAFMRLFERWLNFIEDGDSYEAQKLCLDTGMVGYKLKTLQKLREVHFDYLKNGLSDVLPIADDLSDNDELVKAVLLSGVGTVLQHRSWDIVKGRLKKANCFVTRNNHKATITSESVNYKKSRFSSNFLLYINEVVSNLRHTTLVRETSVISPLAVLLFRTGNLNIEEVANENICDKLKSSDQVMLLLEKTKIGFLCDRRQATAIKECKEVLRNCVQYYIYQLTEGGMRDPEIDDQWQGILESLNYIFDCFSNTVNDK